MSPVHQTTDPLIGTTLEGGYHIEGLLGAGGMGAVYKAMHVRLAKHVAVKVMAAELTANSESLARFHREALVTGSLGHPHIVQVFDFSTTPAGQPFLVMEFLEGEDLDKRLNRVNRLSTGDVLHIAKQVASALDATHAKGIVHRDLKPANIYLLDAAGEANFVKVLDFGISKMRAATRQLTRTSSVMGTPNYMSPEQALGRIDEIDERTDQWALACIVWECLSGERTFDGEEGTSILYQVVHEAPPSLVEKVPKLRPAVEDVLRRALAKNRDERFPTVNEFAAALECAITGASASAAVVSRTVEFGSRSSPNPSPPTTLSRTNGELAGLHPTSSPGSSRLVWAAAMAATATLLLAAVFFFRHERTKAPPVVGQSTALQSSTSHAPPSPPSTVTAPSSPLTMSPPDASPAPRERTIDREAAMAMEPSVEHPQTPPTSPAPRAKPKKVKPLSDPKSEGAPRGDLPSPPKRPTPTRTLDEEEDKWRLD